MQLHQHTNWPKSLVLQVALQGGHWHCGPIFQMQRLQLSGPTDVCVTQMLRRYLSGTTHVWPGCWDWIRVNTRKAALHSCVQKAKEQVKDKRRCASLGAFLRAWCDGRGCHGCWVKMQSEPGAGSNCLWRVPPVSGSDTSPQRGIGKGEEVQSVREGKAELRVVNL